MLAYLFVLLAVVPVILSSSTVAIAAPSTGAASTSLDVIEASVTGTPQINRDIGGTQRTAEYLGAGTGAGDLLFGYEVQPVAQHDDGIGAVARSLSLNGRIIKSTDDSTETTLTYVTEAAADRKVDTGIALISNHYNHYQASAVDDFSLISTRQDSGSLPTVAVAAPTTSYYSPSGAPVSTEGATLTWKLTRTGDTGSALTLPLTWKHSPSDGGPYANFFAFTDDNPKVESVTFGVGVSEVTLSVDTVDDSVFELNSVLRICISSDADDGYGVTYQARWWECAGFHIQDNDDAQAPLVTITPAKSTASEWDLVTFNVTVSSAVDYHINVRVSTFSVSRVGDSSRPYTPDYQFLVVAGSTTRTVNVQLRNNNRASTEDSFTLRARILNPRARAGSPIGGYRLAAGTRQADIVVTDDDLPVVSVSAPTRQSEATPLTLTFTRTDDLTRSLVVPLSFSQLGDRLPQRVPSVVSFPLGVTEQTITLKLDDGVDEMDGGIILRMQSTDDYLIASDSQEVTILITDDDEPQHISIARSSESVEEGTNVAFTLTRKTLVGDALTTNGQALE